MADLRYDPIFGVWVAVARKRRERPMEFIPLEQVYQQIICPFCRGNEDETPRAVAAWRKDGRRLAAEDDSSTWAVRIIPNKYPSLSEEPGRLPCGPYDCVARDGVQELIIPTPRHVTSISELSVKEMSVCLMASQVRLQTLRESTDVEHLMWFMNCRMAAGASLGHIHFQLMGSPIVSPVLQGRMQRNVGNLRERGESLVTTLLNWELEQETRIVQASENFVMLCPFASRFSFQIWIIPRDPELPFSSHPLDFNGELAGLCRAYIKKLEQLLEQPAYNLLLHLAPTRQSERDHWFIEIFPRLNRMAGYEIGTDIWVNPVPPEMASKRLMS